MSFWLTLVRFIGYVYFILDLTGLGRVCFLKKWDDFWCKMSEAPSPGGGNKQKTQQLFAKEKAQSF